MALSDDFLLELKSRNDIQDVISSYVSISKGGRNPKCLCPFHGEKTASFTIYPETQSFYCFGCGVGGDVVRFIRLIENLDYMDAVKFLADRCSMEMPTNGADDAVANKKRTVYAINRETAKFFYQSLYSAGGKQGLDYYHKRGLSDNVIKKFGLGFAPDSWDSLYKHLKSKGFADEDLLLANVIGRSKTGKVYDFFRKRTMFPVMDVRGNVIAFSGRRLLDSDSDRKYINSSDTPVYKKTYNVYGLNFAKDFCGEEIIIVEGNMDVIALFRMGFKNAIAPLGTAFTEEQAKLISRYTDSVVLMLDSDGAGQKATDRAIGILEKFGLKIKVAGIPNGKDPDEFVKIYKDEAPARMKQILENALSVVDYRLKKASDNLDTEQSDEDRLKFLEKAAEIISGISSPIEKELVAGRLSEKYNIAKASILQRAKQLHSSKRRTEQKKEINRIIHPPLRDDINPDRIKNRRAANAEEGIISMLLRNASLIKKAKELLTPDDFITDFNRRVYEKILQRYNEEKTVDLSLLHGDFNENEFEKIVGITAKGAEHLCNEGELEQCISALKSERAKNVDKAETDEDFADIINQIRNSKE